ncbi:TonB-dependent receptor [Pectobacterium brasiliense]|uniref:TonB-dependent receptor n=1 Tax=Pectobacterium brasiliense TaxID=180957 RepID=UPI001CE1BFAE|nr:TonB-dependent receptor [Pectobacterium brasiliense]MCA5918958.1 TonB-dependent receptor [Pectobacterium brasiliense]MCA5925403.1 TonB-dependent receptor [Pectobacterium brasiliense]MCA5934822.1 TonB-dependent receptor [Pectobacterium brasiliense]MCA5939510.1 TonB-dependent receptor [Pectobacterium brasiliense]MCA5945646.1 TonB-dependent receptor [Pectobacterium brasiliense]
MAINIRKSVALALATTVSTPVIAAQDDTLVVTASGYEQKITEAAASISVVSQDELTKRKYNDLGEALSDVEGVDVRSSTGKTGGLDISIRGMPSDYTLILVDGIRQNGSSDVTPNGFGTMNTSFIPPLAAIERIEVIRGPMSTLYGSDAMGGVVNIITKKASKEWVGNITLDHTFQEDRDYGDASKFSIYSSGALIEDKLGLALRGNILRRDASEVSSSSTGQELSTRGPNPVKSDNYLLGGKLSWLLDSRNTLWLDGEVGNQKYDNKQGQLGTLGASGGYEDTLRYERRKVTLGSDNQLDFGTWNSSLSFNQTETKGRLIPGAAIADATVRANHAGDKRLLKNTNLILDTKVVSPIGDSHLLSVGGQYWNSVMKDGVVQVNSGEKFEQNSWSLFAEDEWRLLDSLALTTGARYEHHEAFGGHVSPRAYLVWNALDELTIKGGVSTGYKTPKLSQLHNGISGVSRQGQSNTIGNPDLKPEKSVNTELGAYYEHFSGFSANATLFHNRFSDKIDSYDIDNNTIGFRNIGKANTQGLELGSTIPLWSDNWTLNVNYTFTDSEQKGGENPGARLTNTPKHMANARLNWNVNEQLSTWLKAEYRGKTARFTENYSTLAAASNQANRVVYDNLGSDFKSFTVVNLGGSYKISKDVTLNGSVNNLLDKDFTKTYVFPVGTGTTTAGDYFTSSQVTSGSVLPGRNYWMSVNINF